MHVKYYLHQKWMSTLTETGVQQSSVTIDRIVAVRSLCCHPITCIIDSQLQELALLSARSAYRVSGPSLLVGVFGAPRLRVHASWQKRQYVAKRGATKLEFHIARFHIAILDSCSPEILGNIQLVTTNKMINIIPKYGGQLSVCLAP